MGSDTSLHCSGSTAIIWSDHSVETALRYGGLYAYDANAQRVPAAFELSPDSPEHLTIALVTAGAAWPITIDPLIATKEQRLSPGNPATETHFGFSLAMQGDVCAIGSPPDDPAAVNPTSGAGSVYLFVRSSSGIWIRTTW